MEYITKKKKEINTLSIQEKNRQKHIDKINQLSNNTMQVNIYKEAKKVRQIDNVNFTILHSDRSIEINTLDGKNFFFAAEDYEWFNAF